MATETKVTVAYQTQVPAPLREKYGVSPGDRVIWEEAADGSIQVRFRKAATWNDLVGRFPGVTGGDAVAAKRAVQQGRLR